MIYRVLDKTLQNQLTHLFKTVFTSSEGEKEGNLIGNLASELSSNINNEEIICLGAFDDQSLIGAIFFTRLEFNEPVQVYMLAPVAVSTEHQAKGVGQALIMYGLNELKSRSVDFVVTYGDPLFYARVGFQTLPESVIQAPVKLTMPEGWLGQSLKEGTIPSMKERPICVEVFNDPAYW